jgi:hypothetical protein
VGLGTSFAIQFQNRNVPGAFADEQLSAIAGVLQATAPNETIYDMVGSFIFRPDGYYICCHPFGEFITRLQPEPPDLVDSLVKHQTKFVVLDRTGLVFWQTPQPALNFLLTNYLPSRYPKLYVAGAQFSCKNSRCVRTDLNGNPVSDADTKQLTILFGETYTVTTTPPGQTIRLDTQQLADGAATKLTAGTYEFSIPEYITGFTIRIQR